MKTQYDLDPRLSKALALRLSADKHLAFGYVAKANELRHEAIALESSIAAAAAQREANSPLKPKEAQKPLDIGLFSDDANQLDLIEMFMD